MSFITADARNQNVNSLLSEQSSFLGSHDTSVTYIVMHCHMWHRHAFLEFSPSLVLFVINIATLRLLHGAQFTGLDLSNLTEFQHVLGSILIVYTFNSDYFTRHIESLLV